MPTGPIPELPAQVVVDTGDDSLINLIRECLAHPLSDSFTHSMDVLAGMVKGSAGAKIRIWKDFAPLSFVWSAVNSNGKTWLHGGLIYHGQSDGHGSGGAPTFSTTVDHAEGWRLHT